VLVIEPGTSAGGAYFVPLARWIVSRTKNWQVWSVERRENLLEDQSELNLAKRGGASATQVFDYYLGWIKDPSVTHHVTGIPAATYASPVGTGCPRRARRLGGRVILDKAAALARQSHIPRRQVTLVDRHATYAHNDPIGAYPRNTFFSHLLPFLRTVSATAS